MAASAKSKTHASIHNEPSAFEDPEYEDGAPSADHDDNWERSTPFTIVWTALPLITWIIPFIGHIGVTEYL